MLQVNTIKITTDCQMYLDRCTSLSDLCSTRAGVDTAEALPVVDVLLTWHRRCWLNVKAVRLLLRGQTLSELAGGNFTPCKQEKESAAHSTPEGNFLQPTQQEERFSLHLFIRPHTHTEYMCVYEYIYNWHLHTKKNIVFTYIILMLTYKICIAKVIIVPAVA